MKKRIFTLIFTLVTAVFCCCSLACSHVDLQDIQTHKGKLPASIVKYQHHNVDLCILRRDSQLQTASLKKSVDLDNDTFVESFCLNVLKSDTNNSLLSYAKENAFSSKKLIANSVRAP